MADRMQTGPGTRKACGLCCTRIENFGVRIGRTEILKDIQLHIHCGILTAVIGPNGAGKTTLLRALLGEVKHSGQIRFLDHKDLHTNRPLIGYVPQRLPLDRDSPVSVLDLFASARSSFPVWLGAGRSVRRSVREELSRVQADHLIDRRLGDLSGGELQRVLLAMAVEPVPDLLLLDEPVSGVDQAGLALFYEIVSDLRRSYDLSIILVSHDLGLVAKYADKVILLNRTIEASGTPAEVFRHPRFIEIFGAGWQNTLGSSGVAGA